MRKTRDATCQTKPQRNGSVSIKMEFVRTCITSENKESESSLVEDVLSDGRLESQTKLRFKCKMKTTNKSLQLFRLATTMTDV